MWESVPAAGGVPASEGREGDPHRGSPACSPRPGPALTVGPGTLPASLVCAVGAALTAAAARPRPRRSPARRGLTGNGGRGRCAEPRPSEPPVLRTRGARAGPAGCRPRRHPRTMTARQVPGCLGALKGPQLCLCGQAPRRGPQQPELCAEPRSEGLRAVTAAPAAQGRPRQASPADGDGPDGARSLVRGLGAPRVAPRTQTASPHDRGQARECSPRWRREGTERTETAPGLSLTAFQLCARGRA